MLKTRTDDKAPCIRLWLRLLCCAHSKLVTFSVAKCCTLNAYAYTVPVSSTPLEQRQCCPVVTRVSSRQTMFFLARPVNFRRVSSQFTTAYMLMLTALAYRPPATVWTWYRMHYYSLHVLLNKFSGELLPQDTLQDGTIPNCRPHARREICPVLCSAYNTGSALSAPPEVLISSLPKFAPLSSSSTPWAAASAAAAAEVDKSNSPPRLADSAVVRSASGRR